MHVISLDTNLMKDAGHNGASDLYIEKELKVVSIFEKQ